MYFLGKIVIMNWNFSWSDYFRFFNISKLYQYHIHAIIFCLLLLLINMKRSGITILYFTRSSKSILIMILLHIIINDGYKVYPYLFNIVLKEDKLRFVISFIIMSYLILYICSAYELKCLLNFRHKTYKISIKSYNNIYDNYNGPRI